MKTMTTDVQKIVNQKLGAGRKSLKITTSNEKGIVLPAILWWIGVPFSLLLVLWLIGIL